MAGKKAHSSSVSAFASRYGNSASCGRHLSRCRAAHVCNKLKLPNEQA